MGNCCSVDSVLVLQDEKSSVAMVAQQRERSNVTELYASKWIRRQVFVTCTLPQLEKQSHRSEHRAAAKFTKYIYIPWRGRKCNICLSKISLIIPYQCLAHGEHLSLRKILKTKNKM